MSSSKDFIVKLEEKLQEMGLPKRTINEQETKNGISYKFRYGHQDSLKLFNLMYKDVDKCIYLERKYIKFIEGIKQGAQDGKTN